MTLLDNIQLAIRALKANKLRTVLTLLIIAFGIMALISILTSIEAIKVKLTENFVELGATAFTIQYDDGVSRRKKSENPKISIQEGESFKSRYKFPATIALYTKVGGSIIAKSRFAESNPNVSLEAVDFDYLKVTGKNLWMGRSFSQIEMESGSNVAIIGFDVAAKLFQDKDSIIGAPLAVDGRKYRIIGVIKPKGASAGKNDNYILIPYTNAKQEFSISNKSFEIIVEAGTTVEMERAIEEASGVFRSVRKLEMGAEDNFSIVRSDKLASTYLNNIRFLSLATIVIGFLTLIGAGVGLMNIMLVSVNERTREIGVSKSLGATKKIIFTQFLTEATTICVLGGIMGIILGVFFGNIVSLFLKTGFVLAINWVIFGLIFCTIIGLLAGLYPAIRASKLNPVDALRYE
jgi:putative ABC transport system permease protein